MLRLNLRSDWIVQVTRVLGTANESAAVFQRNKATQLQIVFMTSGPGGLELKESFGRRIKTLKFKKKKKNVKINVIKTSSKRPQTRR